MCNILFSILLTTITRPIVLPVCYIYTREALLVQVHINGGNLTAKNSTSMQRAPGPPTQNIKGESTDLPFWPGITFDYQRFSRNVLFLLLGGLDEPDIVSKVVGNKEEFIDFENGKLICYTFKWSIESTRDYFL